ncbi:hypothetical protein [Amycolatopsis sp. NBC_01480]|uniref:hypothetical protein n=1 Tax=Amycolatopsis sp. NBC_01480 TaxID=2903562 RepID=UPI002E28B6A6|nr:hypothetical protein [Amycolatopsis sp. NBC_01480]
MNDVPANQPMLSGERVYRIHWVLGTDRLRAVCHCSAEREFDDPVDLWEWLLSHPAGHDTIRSGPDPAPVLASR